MMYNITTFLKNVFQYQMAKFNNTFDQELLMNIQSSGGSRSFAKETRTLKMRSAGA